MRQRFSDRKVHEFFRRHGLPGSITYFNSGGRRIRYIRIHNGAAATIFFIPGAPASLDLYRDYYTHPRLRERFDMIAVDRPGYGGSGYGRPEPSVARQSSMMLDLLDREKRLPHPLLICAGSYGASIACRMLMDRPAAADGLLLDCPSLAPGEEKYFWFTGAIEKTFLKQIIPPHYRSANSEKYHHRRELAEMLPYWEKVRVPVIYVQGEKDNIVYTSNAEFAKARLVNVPFLEVVMVPGRKHLTILREVPLIVSKLISLYRKVIPAHAR